MYYFFTSHFILTQIIFNMPWCGTVLLHVYFNSACEFFFKLALTSSQIMLNTLKHIVSKAQTCQSDTYHRPSHTWYFGSCWESISFRLLALPCKDFKMLWCSICDNLPCLTLADIFICQKYDVKLTDRVTCNYGILIISPPNTVMLMVV